MSSLPPDRSHVLTETAHPSGRDLGAATVRESIEWIAEDHQRVVQALRAVGDQLEALIEAGADVDRATGNGYTPCCIAAERGHVEVVKELIKAGADVARATWYSGTPCYVAAGAVDWQAPNLAHVIVHR